MGPGLAAEELRRIARKIDGSCRPSLRLVSRDLRRLASNMRAAASGPVSLASDGEVSIYDIDVKYEFFSMEKGRQDEMLKFGMRFVLGSDLEERTAVGQISASLSSMQLSRYVYRGADLANTGLPGSISGDSELSRFGLLPNIVVKCLKDAMARIGLSSLKGVEVTDSGFHP